MKVFAQQLENPLLNESIKNIKGIEFVRRLLPLLVSWLILIGFITFLIYFLIGGLNWITSQGDKNKIEEAKKQLTNAIIGLFIVFSIFLIIKIIGWVLGISNLQELIISLPRL